MIINIATIALRKQHYIGRTLDSLFQSDGRDIRVNLILGSRDTSHVEQYKNVANIVAWDHAAQWLSKEGELRHNCNINAIRALKYGDDEYCLCCEDDISFDPHWCSELMRIIEEIEGQDYVLNLGAKSDRPPEGRYVKDAEPFLAGSFGIFYPNSRIRNAIGDFIEENMTAGRNDALIGKYAREHATLYNTTPPLVWHIGAVSNFA